MRFLALALTLFYTIPATSKNFFVEPFQCKGKNESIYVWNDPIVERALVIVHREKRLIFSRCGSVQKGQSAVDGNCRVLYVGQVKDLCDLEKKDIRFLNSVISLGIFSGFIVGPIGVQTIVSTAVKVNSHRANLARAFGSNECARTSYVMSRARGNISHHKNLAAMKEEMDAVSLLSLALTRVPMYSFTNRGLPAEEHLSNPDESKLLGRLLVHFDGMGAKQGDNPFFKHQAHDKKRRVTLYDQKANIRLCKELNGVRTWHYQPPEYPLDPDDADLGFEPTIQ